MNGNLTAKGKEGKMEGKGRIKGEKGSRREGNGVEGIGTE